MQLRVPESARPWRWYHQVPARDTGGVLGAGALHDHTALAYVGDERRYLVERRGGALVVRRENRRATDPPVDPAWTQTFDVGAAGAPVIGAERAIHVAAPTARGYVALALDPDSGALRWRRVHEGEDGAGPVQLELVSGHPVVAYVHAPSGPYLHELSAETGELVARVRFGPEVHREFVFPEALAAPLGQATPQGYRLVRRRERLGVEGPGWRTTLSDQDPFTTHAAFVIAGDRLVVVTFCAGASGAVAYGLERESGALAWTASPGSIGSVGHSRYSSEVRAVLEGERVVVYGQESAGRYCGLLEPSSGRLLGYEVWRR